MSAKRSPCAAIETDLLAAAMGEAERGVADAVAHHVATCRGCRDQFEGYRAVEAAVGAVRAATDVDSDGARHNLLERLADLRARIVRYGVFESPFGPILLAATEHGISLVEYLTTERSADSWLLQQRGVETQADQGELARFHGELMDYFGGRRTRLGWPLDFRFATSDFHRAVLEATAAVPYGAVSSYAGIAREIGKPAAVRAVAQALRHNPLPIVVPCHRIVGSSGALVGYAGNRIALKEHLLGVEGVRTEQRRDDLHIDRGAMYAWDHRGREYCLPTCGEISKLPIGAVTLIASTREAGSLGLTPCGDCHPDQHPLTTS